MRIISWNVNGLRAVERKESLGEFVNDYSPDILLLQETKSKPEQVEFLDTVYPDYKKFYVSAEKPGYSGVAIWMKVGLEAQVRNLEFTAGMPNDPVLDEGRIARVDFTLNKHDFSVLGTYFPNGGKSDEAWQHKLKFYEAWLDYVNSIRTTGRKVIWTGDVNCAHQALDLARPKDNDGKIGFHPQERAWLDRWQEAGWTDVWRYLNPTKTEVYSWWHMISRSRGRNVGWRIDYFWIDEALMSNVKNIAYLNDQMGSDHCPVMLEIE
jgi:exodeoxyribonuclease-3